MRSFKTLLTGAALGLSLTAGAVLAADNYKLDPEHSFVVFRINHLGVSQTYGRFNDPTGTVVWDTADPTKSTINIEIDATKVDTDNPQRDNHLKNPDFFNAKEFPKITFKSKSLKADGEGKFLVTGDLTLHGQTKSITVPLTKVGEAQTQMGYRAGWEAIFDIKRSDFGMGNMVGPVGDDVRLMVSLEAVKG